jgi:hypothetical protein
MSNHCYGCLVYKNGEGDYCVHSVHNTELEGLCPCTTCLIKGVCQKECDEYANWINSE